jgi:hypothetical protein
MRTASRLPEHLRKAGGKVKVRKASHKRPCAFGKWGGKLALIGERKPLRPYCTDLNVHLESLSREGGKLRIPAGQLAVRRNQPMFHYAHLRSVCAV